MAYSELPQGAVLLDAQAAESNTRTTAKWLTGGAAISALIAVGSVVQQNTAMAVTMIFSATVLTLGAAWTRSARQAQPLAALAGTDLWTRRPYAGWQGPVDLTRLVAVYGRTIRGGCAIYVFVRTDPNRPRNWKGSAPGAIARRLGVPDGAVGIAVFTASTHSRAPQLARLLRDAATSNRALVTRTAEDAFGWMER